MRRKYVSMEDELRMLRARGESGMSQGFEYKGRRRFGGRFHGMQASDETVSTWNLGDKEARNSGLRPDHAFRGTGTVKIPAANARRQAVAPVRQPAPPVPGAMRAGRGGRQFSPGKFVVMLLLLIVIIVIPLLISLFNIIGSVTDDWSEDDAGYESDWEEESDGAESDSSPSYNDADPVFNLRNLEVFFSANASEADPVTVDEYANDFYLEDFDIDADLPDDFNYYVGSDEGKLLIALTFWSWDYDDDEIPGVRDSALAYIRQAEPAIRAALDDEFGTDAVPLAITLYDFTADETLLIVQNGEILYNAD